MSEELTIYKCNICGNVIEKIIDGGPVPVCCGHDMEKQEPKTEDMMAEKHVPFVTFEDENGYVRVKIQIGEQEHPMSEEHYIQFIEAYSKDKVYLKRKYLQPSDQPELKFLNRHEEMIVRAYCNIHGLWEKVL